jgi:hypothetical protein
MLVPVGPDIDLAERCIVALAMFLQAADGRRWFGSGVTRLG